MTTLSIPRPGWRLAGAALFASLLLVGGWWRVAEARDRGPGQPALRPHPAEARQLQPGDLIFRRGQSLASDVVLSLDADAAYSHVGLLIAANGQRLAVAHAAPGEAAAAAPEPIRIDPLSAFLAPGAAVAAAIYRPLDPAAAARAATIASRYAERRLPFDARFRLDTADQLYCTELVWRAFHEAGVELLDHPPRTIDNLLLQGPVILPSDLLRSSKLRRLLDFTTKENEDVSR